MAMIAIEGFGSIKNFNSFLMAFIFF